jgi:OHCU decarboxylase
MTEQEFIRRFGGIYEHSTWVAEKAAEIVRDVENIDTIAAVMADCVDNAAKEKRLELIRAHPDLAGKAAVAGELTDDSNADLTAVHLKSTSASRCSTMRTEAGSASRSSWPCAGDPGATSWRHSRRA